MREAMFWIAGAAVAFFVTAGAFLLLANLATDPAGRSLKPDPPSDEPGRALTLNMDADRLASLKARPHQKLDLVVENEGEEDLSDVNLTLEVSSENTAVPEARYYRNTVEKLPAGKTATIHFDLDLSDPERTPGSGLTVVPEPPRKILEIRATTPEGVHAIRTAILPL